MLPNLVIMLKERFWKDKRRRSSVKGNRQPNTNSCDHNNDVHSASSDPNCYHCQHSSSSSSVPDYLIEEEFRAMEHTVNHLLSKLVSQSEDQLRPCSSSEECMACMSSRATVQTYPCGHKALCRKCFTKTVQIAIVSRNLPMRCALCRTEIVRLRTQTGGRPVTVRVQGPPAIPSDPFHSSSAPVVCSNTLRLGRTVNNSSSDYTTTNSIDQMFGLNFSASVRSASSSPKTTKPARQANGADVL